MKRISIFLLAILFVLGGFYVTNPNKDQVVILHKPMNISNLMKKLPEIPKIETFETTANSAILMDAETGHIVYEKNKDLSLPAASMSKSMSELLILEAI